MSALHLLVERAHVKWPEKTASSYSAPERQPKANERCYSRAGLVSAGRVRHHIHCDGGGENHQIILPWGDLHPIGICNAKPLLGDLGHLLSTGLDRVLMIENIALNLHVWSSADVDRPAVTQWRNHRLLDGREGLAVGSLDLDRKST